MDSTTMLWNANPSVMGGGTYIPIPNKSVFNQLSTTGTYLSAPHKSNHTYLSVGGPKFGQNANLAFVAEEAEAVPDTSRLILRSVIARRACYSWEFMVGLYAHHLLCVSFAVGGFLDFFVTKIAN